MIFSAGVAFANVVNTFASATGSSPLYATAVVAKVAHPSIGVMRLVPALFTTLTILAVMALAQIWRGRQFALWSGLAAAASQWAFQFARIFWDPPLAPAFLMWGLVFWFTPRLGRMTGAVLCGLCVSLALYSYPPMRVQAPLVMAAAVLIQFDWRRTLTAALSVLALSLPLILKTLSGEIQGRFQMLSVFDDNYVRQFGNPTLGLKLELFLSNLQLHFSPWFLFFQGDRSLRHSTQRVGEWSGLDLAGVLLLAVAFVRRVPTESRSWSRSKVVVLCGWGYFCGILPAAMTWEASPHALRAIGAWPFLSLLAGLGISELTQGRLAKVIHATCLALTVGFCGYFLWDYFMRYPERSRDWFDVIGVERLMMVDRPIAADYPDLPRKYFDLVYRQVDRCP